MTRTSARRAAGFTLLDSLIAVVVLATGILALTLLQTSMLRNAADARERSIAMALAQNLLEESRSRANQTQAGYQNLANQGTFASGACDYADAGALVPAGSTGLQIVARLTDQIGGPQERPFFVNFFPVAGQ